MYLHLRTWTMMALHILPSLCVSKFSAFRSTRNYAIYTLRLVKHDISLYLLPSTYSASGNFCNPLTPIMCPINFKMSFPILFIRIHFVLCVPLRLFLASFQKTTFLLPRVFSSSQTFISMMEDYYTQHFSTLFFLLK